MNTSGRMGRKSLVNIQATQRRKPPLANLPSHSDYLTLSQVLSVLFLSRLLLHTENMSFFGLNNYPPATKKDSILMQAKATVTSNFRMFAYSLTRSL
jgi:hypothetical protein